MTTVVLLALAAVATVAWVVTARLRARQDPRLAAFRREVDAACEAADSGAAERLLARRAELGLTEDEAAVEIEMIEALRDLAEFRAAIDRDGLPALDTRHRVLGADRCHFWTAAFDPERVEAGGKLFLTATRLVFLGGGVRATPWHAVAKVTREGRDLVVSVPSRQAVDRYRTNAHGEAMRALLVAERLIDARRGGRTPPRAAPV